MSARPVVTTSAVAASSDLVVDGETGLRHAVGDVWALADRLSFLTKNPHVARRMGDAARRRVEGFSFENGYRGLMQALENTRAA